MERDMIYKANRGADKNLLPARPPAELIPAGHAKKVLVMWLSFFGALVGIAGHGSPVAIALPVCLAVLAADVMLILQDRFKNRPVWLYRQAQQSFCCRRYDRALKKLDQLMDLRPEMNAYLLPVVMVCSGRIGDYTRAAECLNVLLSQRRINGSSSPALILAALDILHKRQAWDRIPDIAAFLPDNDMYSQVKSYYKEMALYNAGQAAKVDR